MHSKSLVVTTIRWIVVAAVIGSVLAGAAMVAVGLLSIMHSIWETAKEGEIGVEVLRSFSVDVIEVADAFLLGIVMFIIAVGLYQLFVNPDIEVPEWLRVSTLSDLKEDLLAVTIVLLGISFLGRVVEWEGDKNIIYFGAAIAAVLVPLVAMFGLLFMVNQKEAVELEVEEPAPVLVREVRE